MKVKDFLKVYEDGYLVIETGSVVYTDNKDYLAEAIKEHWYDKPIEFFTYHSDIDDWVRNAEITGIDVEIRADGFAFKIYAW